MRLPYRCNGGLTIVLAGLGGQGILLMAKAIASAARKRFEFVCRSEFRGLSQRGGAVQSCVRFASNPVTSVVDVEEADLILALDALEAARALPYLKQGGLVVAHVGVVPPLHISRTWQEAGCPKREAQLFSTYVLERFEGIENVQMLDLDTLAKKVGSTRVQNSVLLGAASSLLDVPCDTLLASLLEGMKPEFMEINRRAFEIGRRAQCEAQSVSTGG